MSAINWIPGDPASRVELVGKGHPTKTDTLNRALREVISLSGLDPDADFGGFLPIGDAFTKTQADALYAAVGAAYTKAEAAALFAAIGASHTKAEANALFAAIGASYLKAAADAKFAALAGAAFTGALSTTGAFTATGQINANGGVVGQLGFKVVTANYTLTAADQVVLVNATANNVTITAPAATLGKYGWTIGRLDSSGFSVNVAASGTDTLIGAETLARAETASVVLNGTDTAYVLHGVTAATISANSVTAGEFPDTVSFAGEVAFKNITSFAQGAFFNGTVVYQVTQVAASGATRALSYSASVLVDMTLTAADCALTLTNANQGAVMEILIRQDATGSRTITWPASVKLPTGFTLTTAANSATKVRLWYDGSNHWLEELGEY